MYPSGRSRQRRSPFTGGIWDFSPFRSSDGNGGNAPRPIPPRANTPVRMRFGYNYEDYEDYDNYNYYAGDDEDDYEHDYNDADVAFYGPARRDMRPIGGHSGGNAPTGQNFSYTSYRDSDGNVREQGYGPGGSYGRSMGRGQVNGMSGDLGRAGGSLHAGRGAGGPFLSSFWTGANPFRGVNGRTGSAGVPSWERSVQPDEAFAVEYAPAPLPRDNGLSEDNGMIIAEFLQQHTKPAAYGGANAPPNSECPICLEPPSGSHGCVQIKGIPGCSHMIGRECLYELMIRNSDEKKECPLCRAEFLASNFIEQGSEEWNQLAQGRGGPPRSRAPVPARHGGAPTSHAPAARGPPTSYAAVARGPSRGVSNVRGMGDVGTNALGRGSARGSPPGNFNGAGQRLGGSQSGYYQQQYAPNYGGRNYAGRRGRM